MAFVLPISDEIAPDDTLASRGISPSKHGARFAAEPNEIERKQNKALKRYKDRQPKVRIPSLKRIPWGALRAGRNLAMVFVPPVLDFVVAGMAAAGTFRRTFGGYVDLSVSSAAAGGQ